jgi:hypothetical protein
MLFERARSVWNQQTRDLDLEGSDGRNEEKASARVSSRSCLAPPSQWRHPLHTTFAMATLDTQTTIRIPRSYKEVMRLPGRNTGTSLASGRRYRSSLKKASLSSFLYLMASVASEFFGG